MSDGERLDFLVYKFFQEKLKLYNREHDLLIALENEKTIFNVEVKSSRNDTFKNKLKKSCKEQIKIQRENLIGLHKDILNQDWKLISVAAMPFVQSEDAEMDEFCAYCRKFILDENIFRDLNEWVKETIGFKHEQSEGTDKSYEKLYNRIVGFMSISDAFGVSTSYFFDGKEAGEHFEEAVLGKSNAKGVSCEEALETSINLQKVKVKDFKDKNLYLSSLKTLIFWCTPQLQFLTSKNKHVVFMADYGVGKSLLKKHMAIKLSEEEKDSKVLYISFASAIRTGDDHKIKQKGAPAVFDVANSLDFDGTRVKFVSLTDITQSEEISGDFTEESRKIKRILRTLS